ncbi:hypothetical protein T265_16230, partial [Opisthorchis viverrini]
AVCSVPSKPEHSCPSSRRLYATAFLLHQSTHGGSRLRHLLQPFRVYRFRSRPRRCRWSDSRPRNNVRTYRNSPGELTPQPV